MLQPVVALFIANRHVDARLSSDAVDRLPHCRPWPERTKGRIPNTPLCIDDFHPSNVQVFLDTPLASSCQLLFFLSHLHADHTRGLTPSWQHGHIYTTHTNRHLLLQRFSLPPQCITAIHFNTPTSLALSPHHPHLRFTVTLLPVCHCPGACMLLLDGYWGRIVYTGDMRWLAGTGLGGEGGALLSRPIDVLYLDNTYGKTSATSPS